MGDIDEQLMSKRIYKPETNENSEYDRYFKQRQLIPTQQKYSPVHIKL